MASTLDWNRSGFSFIACTKAWDRAFEEAREVLRKASACALDTPETVVVLGPKISSTAEAWLRREAGEIYFGKILSPWSQWLRDHTRDSLTAKGLSFRELTSIKGREKLRSFLAALEESGKLKSIGSLWREERFFAVLLGELLELRKAGFDNKEEVFRARDQVQASAITLRMDPEELWYLLLLWEQSLEQANLLDEAKVLRLAAQEIPKTNVFLLGFERFTLLEAQFLQAIAQGKKVVMPTLGAAGVNHPLVQQVILGFSGGVEYLQQQKQIIKRIPYLRAHTPSEEAFSSGTWIKALTQPVRLVLGKDLQNPLCIERLCLGMGIQATESLLSLAPISNPLVDVLLRSLELKDFSLESISDYAHFLAHLRADPRYAEIPPLLTRLGFRRGLTQLRELCEGQEFLSVIVEDLTQRQRLIPREASAREFHLAFTEWFRNGEYFKWAENSKLEKQREAHEAIAVLFKATLQLASEYSETLSQQEWFTELRELLASASATQVGPEYAGFECYAWGDWLPPAGSSKTIVLGLSQSANPQLASRFYLDELARGKLQDWSLETQRELDQNAIAYMEALVGSDVVASYAKFSQLGSEQGPSWLMDLYGNSVGDWPEPVWPVPLSPWNENPEFELGNLNKDKISVSYLNSWGECPFRAWAQNEVKLEDHFVASDLDLSPREQGSAFHRAIELFYTKYQGRNLRDLEAIRTAGLQAIEDAFTEQKWTYYKGGQRLFTIHKKLLCRRVIDLLIHQAGYFSENPQITGMLCEQDFSYSLGSQLPVVKGKIDRIDTSDEGFIVVDYKLGSSVPPTKKVLENENLQLPLYLLHSQKQIQTKAIGGYFLSLKDPDASKKGMLRKEFNRGKEKPGYVAWHARNSALLTEEKFAEVLLGAESRAKERIQKICSGDFSVSPHDDTDCSRCSVRPVCRKDAIQENPVQQRAQDNSVFFGLAKAIEEAHQKSQDKPSPPLTDEQRAAADIRNHFVFVEASAGTGKTTLMVDRILSEIRERSRIEEQRQALEGILAISFTEKSTQELQTRVAKRVSVEFNPLLAAQVIKRVSTIHSFCASIIRDYPTLVNVSPLSRTITGLEAREIQEEVLEELFVNPQDDEKVLLENLFPTYTRYHLHIAMLDIVGKRSLLEQDKALNVLGFGDSFLALAKAFFARYDRIKQERGLLDFNDLESKALKILETHSLIYQRQFSLVLVDEFQDTNSLQRSIIEKITKPGWKNLFVVGDAKQSIYRFRDADVAMFQQLRAEAQQNQALHVLSKNFRSQEKIVNWVNQFCSRFMPAEAPEEFEASFSAAVPQRNAGEPVKACFSAKEEQREARALASLAKSLIAKGTDPGDIAILLRKLSGKQEFSQALRDEGISFIQEGGEDYFSDSVVLDGVSLLRFFYSNKNHLSLAALLRSPWFQIPAKDLDVLMRDRLGIEQLLAVDPRFTQLRSWRAFPRRASDFLRRAYFDHPYLGDSRRRAQADKLITWVAELERAGHNESTICLLLSRWSGYEEKSLGVKEKRVPEQEGHAKAIRLSTVHASKGLEYPVVILGDLDSRNPPERSPIRYYPGLGLIAKDPEAEEDPPEFTQVVEANKKREFAESKRLLYVAVTRAKDELYLVIAPSEKSNKLVSWGDWARAYAIGAGANAIMIEANQLPTQNEIEESLQPFLGAWQTKPYPHKSTVSELAAFCFCPEFHRLKFVQRWEDSVLAFFPKDPVLSRKLAREKNFESRLLEALGLEKKERGIALHRVLERLEHGSGSREWRTWLREIYEKQGAKQEVLDQLIEIDVAVIERFLASDFGQILFSQGVKAYNEIPFFARQNDVPLIGAVDRVVDLGAGEWIVADYKSSLAESNRERYTLQVWIYMKVLKEALVAKGLKVNVRGLLIDLYELKGLWLQDDVWRKDEYDKIFPKIVSSYTFSQIPNFSGGPHCFHCPYVSHCDVGRNSVLQL